MKYSKEFKEEAIKLSDEIGLKKAAQQLGIQYYTLSDWRSKRNAAIKARKNQMSDEEANKQILELERENAELRKANDILKDALGFFAKDRKK
ncbi:MAG: transposase [Oribacterium sp.]|nr:transposase [Oribacterium sp.]